MLDRALMLMQNIFRDDYGLPELGRFFRLHFAFIVVVQMPIYIL